MKNYIYQTHRLVKKIEYFLKSDFWLSLVLLDDRVRKITYPCQFCTRKYERTSGFFGFCLGVEPILTQGDATYYISKLCAFQFQRRRILKFAVFVSMFQYVTPETGVTFDPRGII